MTKVVNMYKLPRDIIVLPEEKGIWLVMNVFARSCLAVDICVLEFLSSINLISNDEIKTKFSDYNFTIWQVEHFSNSEGLLADPTRYIRDYSKWPEPLTLRVGALIDELEKHFIIIEDEEEYLSRFAPKNSLMDNFHFGNFHQQLGKQLLLEKRELPSKWWLRQKFTKDLRNVRDNLYGAIQASFLDRYFKERFSAENVVVDIGCGIGFYTNKMAKYTSSVLGLDPNEEYINIARQNAEENAKFEVAKTGEKNGLDKVPSNYADYVLISDALLFYFIPPESNQNTDIQVLFNDIKRILKPGGKFISIEPNYIFWLLPWLGEVKHPFTILTEYLQRNFSVTVSISKLIQSFTKEGFAVVHMEELTPDSSFKSLYPRAYHFASQFPLWQLFELTNIEEGRL